MRLNSSKTRILTQKDAFDFFCIAENEYLARAEALLEKHSSSQWATASIGRSLLMKYEQWLQRTPTGGPGVSSVLLRSNGSKIHKYILRLIYQSGGRVSNEDLLWTIRNDPAMRSTAFMYLAKSKQPNRALSGVHSIFVSGIFIDDASLVNMTGFLLHTRFRLTGRAVGLTREIAKKLEGMGQLGLWCAIHTTCRFSFPAEILYLLRRNAYRIGEDYWSARSAGGVFARFAGNSAALNHYIRIIREIGSENTFEVYEYLRGISTANSLPPATLAYLKAPNPTYPQYIYYPKVLSLLALSQNTSLTSTYIAAKKQHPDAFSDPFYKSMGLK